MYLPVKVWSVFRDGVQWSFGSLWDTRQGAEAEMARLSGPYYVLGIEVKSAKSLDKMAPVHRVETVIREETDPACHKCRSWDGTTGSGSPFGQCRFHAPTGGDPATWPRYNACGEITATWPVTYRYYACGEFTAR